MNDNQIFILDLKCKVTILKKAKYHLKKPFFAL